MQFETGTATHLRGSAISPTTAPLADKSEGESPVADVEGDAATLGKTAGKDAHDNKPTYVTVLGLDAARRHADELRNQAQAALRRLAQRRHRPMGA